MVATYEEALGAFWQSVDLSLWR